MKLKQVQEKYDDAIQVTLSHKPYSMTEYRLRKIGEHGALYLTGKLSGSPSKVLYLKVGKSKSVVIVSKQAYENERKSFYADDFYKDPKLTLDVLNALNIQEYMIGLDMYESGTFLQMEVHRNEKTEEILSKVISDLDAYAIVDREDYISSQKGIALSSLQEDHHKYYGGDFEIMWDKESNSFIFKHEQ